MRAIRTSITLHFRRRTPLGFTGRQFEDPHDMLRISGGHQSQRISKCFEICQPSAEHPEQARSEPRPDRYHHIGAEEDGAGIAPHTDLFRTPTPYIQSV